MSVKPARPRLRSLRQAVLTDIEHLPSDIHLGPPATAGGSDPDDDILEENEDFYREGATIVFTARYHLRRGYCCNSGCRHCPFKEGERGDLESIA